MITYKVLTTTIVVEDEKHITYGISCTDDKKEIARIEDISVNKEEVEKTVEKFNNNKLEPEHFNDAVEDSLI